MHTLLIIETYTDWSDCGGAIVYTKLGAFRKVDGRHKRNMFWIADVNPWQFKAAGTSFMFTNQKLSQSEVWLVKRYGYNVGPPFTKSQSWWTSPQFHYGLWYPQHTVFIVLNQPFWRAEHHIPARFWYQAKEKKLQMVKDQASLACPSGGPWRRSSQSWVSMSHEQNTLVNWLL